MCLQTACSLLQLAKWSLPGKAVERRGRGPLGALVLLVGGCSAREITIRSRSRPALVHALQDPD